MDTNKQQTAAEIAMNVAEYWDEDVKHSMNGFVTWYLMTKLRIRKEEVEAILGL